MSRTPAASPRPQADHPPDNAKRLLRNPDGGFGLSVAALDWGAASSAAPVMRRSVVHASIESAFRSFCCWCSAPA